LALVPLTDKDLAQKVVRGDGEAFNLLVGRWEQKLFSYCLRLTGDRDDAFDVCQDTFVKAYEQIGQLQNHDKFAHGEADDAAGLENLLSEDPRYGSTMPSVSSRLNSD
jgi:hypothetical protein